MQACKDDMNNKNQQASIISETVEYQSKNININEQQSLQESYHSVKRFYSDGSDNF